VRAHSPRLVAVQLCICSSRRRSRVHHRRRNGVRSGRFARAACTHRERRCATRRARPPQRRCLPACESSHQLRVAVPLRQRLYARGALSRAAAAMSEHGHNESAVDLACRFIVGIAASEAAQIGRPHRTAGCLSIASAGNAGQHQDTTAAISAVIAALRRYEASAAVAEHGCLALGTLANRGDAKHAANVGFGSVFTCLCSCRQQPCFDRTGRRHGGCRRRAESARGQPRCDRSRMPCPGTHCRDRSLHASLSAGPHTETQPKAARRSCGPAAWTALSAGCVGTRPSPLWRRTPASL
jgi:hypothetical protein